jgi:hypothetical protein
MDDLWFDRLDPSVRRESLSEAEWKLLLEAHSKYGNHWAEIVKSGMIPGRTANQLKNHCACQIASCGTNLKVSFSFGPPKPKESQFLETTLFGGVALILNSLVLTLLYAFPNLSISGNTRVRRRMTDQSRKRNRAAALAASTSNARASPSHSSSENHHTSSDDGENSLDDDDTVESGEDANMIRIRASTRGRPQIPSAASIGRISMSKSADALLSSSSTPFLGDLEALTAVAAKHADSNPDRADLRSNGFGPVGASPFGSHSEVELQNQLSWQQHQQALMAQQLQMHQSLVSNPQLTALARQQQLQQQLLFQQQQQQQQQQAQALLQSGMSITEIQQHMQLQALLQFQQQQQMLGLLGLSPAGLMSPLVPMQAPPLGNPTTSLPVHTPVNMPNLLAATSNNQFLPSPLANSSSTASTSSPAPPVVVEPITPDKAKLKEEETPSGNPITAMDVTEAPKDQPPAKDVSPAPDEPAPILAVEEIKESPATETASSPA